MKPRHAIITEQQQEHNELLLSLFIPPDLAYFQGHFPNLPVLPGVTQIHWVIDYARQFLACRGQFAGMEVIKFQQPILPNSKVQLSLKWDALKQKLYFNYSSLDKHSGAVIAHASGRILLVNPV